LDQILYRWSSRDVVEQFEFSENGQWNS